ncbi:transglycosylase SLT domain-containing protein [Streptomyces luteolifulvus]|uniref:Transglycosylase SLT domain-containing protein n=1 Tax=Streptomyces luteolifulvus TaxID=2615112 RepID=A0A6H9UPE5_9ACTN|nr:transglycosylase SLT domain-containing protein [Streptomyces luteolifulvus]KAB1139712.1 transglycosylase SLT domain-containing protein [Streptomyces luteolifulvus]
MPKNTRTPGRIRTLTKTHKIAIAGVATLGAAAVAFTAVPSNASTTTSEAAVSSAKVAYSSEQLTGLQSGVADQLAGVSLQGKAIEAQQKAQAEAAAKKKAAAAAAAKKKAAAEAAAKKRAAAIAAAKKKAAEARKAKEAASRAAKRAAIKKAAKKTYANNLDGWIRESLDVMKKHGIPGSYNGIHRNIMRESSGNPNAINNWDINAINGIPSKGLLQVIPPTFQAYHVPGTSWNIYDPVANITAACNYAADRYGSMDNVNSAY